jgi:hypothetical protein
MQTTMSLVDIWKKTPEQIRGKSIQQVLAFAGDGRLKDGNETSIEFREYLAHIPPEELSRYASQCLESAFQDSGLALQDITNQVGKRLGFTVEDGRYRGTTTAIGFDGLWEAKGGQTILVEVKTTDAYRLSLDTAANYRKDLIRQGRLTAEKSSILYVVGRADTGDLEAQVRGSPHAWDIRLISVDALLRLLRIKGQLEDQQTVDRIRDILIPQEFTRVDGIIDLVFSAAKEASEELPIEDAAEIEPERKGKKFTPVNFRAACIERLQQFLNESLVQQSAAIYATPDGTTAVLSGISREYVRSQGKGYWYGFHPRQKEVLEGYKHAWVTFACGSEKQILAIPLKDFVEWLPRFNRTELEDRFYWHIHIGQKTGEWTIDVRKGQKPISASHYLIET